MKVVIDSDEPDLKGAFKMKKRSRAGILLAAAAIVLLVSAVVYAFVFYDNKDDAKEQEEDEVVLQETKNFLVLGLDARKGGTGRTDTIMVVNVDPNQGKLSLLSIPRDTRVPLKGKPDRINAAYVYGGVDMVKEAVENLLDIEIDHHIIIRFQGFIEVVDLLGGVEVTVPERMYHKNEGIDLHPGTQVLDGKDALGFARYRYTKNGDLDRARHQQEILEALRKKMFSPGIITKIPNLAMIAFEYIDTDMTDTDFVKLIGNANKFKDNQLEANTLPGEIVKIDGLWYYEVSEEQIEPVALPFKKMAQKKGEIGEI